MADPTVVDSGGVGPLAVPGSMNTETEAKKLILARFKRLLTEQFDGYLRQYQRAFIAG